MTRTIYGADDVYTRMAWDSLESWRWLSSRSGLPILHPIGVLMFFGKREPFVDQSIEAHRRLQLRLDVLDRPELQRRYPQVEWDGVELGLFEPDLGALMARRAVQTLVKELVAAGAQYRLAAVLPPGENTRQALSTRPLMYSDPCVPASLPTPTFVSARASFKSTSSRLDRTSAYLDPSTLMGAGISIQSVPFEL